MRVGLLRAVSSETRWSGRHFARALYAELERAGVEVTFVAGARATWLERFDIVHALDERDAVHTLGARANSVVTVHALELESAKAPARASIARPRCNSLRRQERRRALARAAALVADTDAGVAALEAGLGARSRRLLARIYPALRFAPPSSSTPLPADVTALGEPFVLVVGSSDRAYRLACELTARAERPLALVFIVPPSAASRFRAESEHGRARVAWVTNPDDALLATLYRSAHCLLLPAPSAEDAGAVLEAQACGCPVVASAHPALSELARSAALLGEGDALVRHLGALHDPPLRERLAALGRDNAELFRSIDLGREYLAIYEDVLTVRPRRL